MDFLIEHDPLGKPADHARWRVAPRNLACEGGGNNSVVQQNPTEATADMPQFGVPGRIYRLHGTREGMVIASPLS